MNGLPVAERLPLAWGAASSRKGKGDVHRGDRVFFWVLRGFGIGTILILSGLALQLLNLAFPILSQQGLSFVVGQEWSPPQDVFGILPFVFGTLVSSALAIAIACPISMGVALFLSEIAPRRVSAAVGFLVEMLAAIPSVVYGLWGIFVLAPLLRTHVQPWLHHYLGGIPGVGALFSGPAYGVGMMSAGLVLAIMITPTISSICREVFGTIPRARREAALALGATRWEAIRLAVLGSSFSGIAGAVILGLGRALGETMAVTMVIGNSNHIALSLFAPGQTMASVIANEYAEAAGGLHLAALASIGLALLLVSVVVNGTARLLVWRAERAQGATS